MRVTSYGAGARPLLQTGWLGTVSLRSGIWTETWGWKRVSHRKDLGTEATRGPEVVQWVGKEFPPHRVSVWALWPHLTIASYRLAQLPSRQHVAQGSVLLPVTSWPFLKSDRKFSCRLLYWNNVSQARRERRPCTLLGSIREILDSSHMAAFNKHVY